MATLLFSIGLVFVFCHTTKLVISLIKVFSFHWHLQHHCYQVTNGYEAYQMIAFGELVHWPPWAEVLSRFQQNYNIFNDNVSIDTFVLLLATIG